MRERFKTPSAVFIMLFRKNNGIQEILLQRRQNTGYMDNFWDLSASGHVEKDESMTEAVIRETKEEIGINIVRSDIKFACFTYAKFDLTYCYIYFCASNWSGTPVIKEPQKCSALKWFDVNNLPQNMIPDRKTTVLNYLKGIYFGEFGWKNENSILRPRWNNY